MKNLKRIILILLLVGVSPLPAVETENGACVILLHGMGRTQYSMSLIEEALLEKGYAVWNASYPSLSEKVEDLAKPAVEAGLEFCAEKNATTIHFVTHSLGGILVRYYLQDHQIKNLGRIVMLAPPNKGSEVSDQMKDDFIYRTFLGPAGQEVGTEKESLPNKLKPIPGEIGIIAGEKDGEPWFLPEIPGKDDGKVAVERTKLPEMKDFLLVKAGHTFIMRNETVINQILYFLENGGFQHDCAEK